MISTSKNGQHVKTSKIQLQYSLAGFHTAALPNKNNNNNVGLFSRAGRLAVENTQAALDRYFDGVSVMLLCCYSAACSAVILQNNGNNNEQQQPRVGLQNDNVDVLGDAVNDRS
jgi:hypothetical protein